MNFFSRESTFFYRWNLKNNNICTKFQQEKRFTIIWNDEFDINPGDENLFNDVRENTLFQF